MNSSAINYNSVNDFPIGIFLLFDFNMVLLIQLVIDDFAMINFSTYGRVNKKVFAFVDPNCWNSISILIVQYLPQ